MQQSSAGPNGTGPNGPDKWAALWVSGLVGCCPPLGVLLIVAPASVGSWDGLRLAYGLFAACGVMLISSVLGGVLYAGALASQSVSKPGRRAEGEIADALVAIVTLFLLNILLMAGVLVVLRWMYGVH